MTEIQCMVCRSWHDIEEPDSTDIGYFVCDECMDDAADAPPPQSDRETREPSGGKLRAIQSF